MLGYPWMVGPTKRGYTEMTDPLLLGLGKMSFSHYLAKVVHFWCMVRLVDAPEMTANDSMKHLAYDSVRDLIPRFFFYHGNLRTLLVGGCVPQNFRTPQTAGFLGRSPPPVCGGSVSIKAREAIHPGDFAAMMAEQRSTQKTLAEAFQSPCVWGVRSATRACSRGFFLKARVIKIGDADGLLQLAPPVLVRIFPDVQMFLQWGKQWHRAKSTGATQ